MKNLALIIIAVVGVSAASFGQTEPSTKPKLDKTPQHMKTEKGVAKKKGTPAKKETPAKKVVN